MVTGPVSEVLRANVGRVVPSRTRARAAGARKAETDNLVRRMLILEALVGRTVWAMKLGSRIRPRAAVVPFVLVLASCGGELAGEERAIATQSYPPVAATPPVRGSAEGTALSSGAGPSDRCSSPERLVLTNGVASVRGETVTARDEFPALDCESRGTADTLVGPQRYYAMSVRAGRTYRFALRPTFHAVLFGFDADVTCNEGALRDACRSRGEHGFASGLINPGTGSPGATVFAVPPPYAATRDGDLVVVVDSDGASGSYELTVREE